MAEILRYADGLAAGTILISTVVDGFASANEADDYVAEEDVDSFDDADDGTDGAMTRRLEEMRVTALERFALMRLRFDTLRVAFERSGYRSRAFERRSKPSRISS
jgi:RNA polymerase primary sigma factor